jgi:hypothetical protein
VEQMLLPQIPSDPHELVSGKGTLEEDDQVYGKLPHRLLELRQRHQVRLLRVPLDQLYIPHGKQRDCGRRRRWRQLLKLPRLHLTKYALHLYANTI